MGLLDNTKKLLIAGLLCSPILVSAQIPVNPGGGGSSTPGGTNGQIQYNNNGAFGGLSTIPNSYLQPNINSTGLLAYDFFDATDYAAGAGTIAHDQSGNGNNCTITLGTNITWAQVGGAYALNFGSTSTATNMIDCTTIATPYAVSLIFKSTAVPSASLVSDPIVGYSNNSGNFFAYTQGQTTLSGAPGFLLNVSGSISSAPMPQTYNMFTFNLTPTSGAGNTMYQNTQFVPSLAPANYGNAVVSGGNLEIGGTHTFGFTSGSGARSISLVGYIVYGTPGVSAIQVQQNYSAAQDYFAKRGIDISQRGTAINARQNFNVTCSGSSLMAGFQSQPPCSTLTLGSTYTVNNTAVSSSGIATRDVAYTNPELYYANPLSGRNLLVIDAPTNDICAAPSFLFTGNSSVANAWAAMLALADKALHPIGADGHPRKGYDTVLLQTMISRTGSAQSPNTGTCDANKDLYNALVRSNRLPAGVVIGDTAAIPVLGADGANSGTIGTIGSCPGATTYFYLDCVHTNTTGSALWGTAINSQILANTGYTVEFPNTQTGATYTILPGDRGLIAAITVPSTWALPACQALVGYNYSINNPSVFTLTIAPSGSDTITGTAAITTLASGSFRAMLTSATLGGCYWLQQ